MLHDAIAKSRNAEDALLYGTCAEAALNGDATGGPNSGDDDLNNMLDTVVGRPSTLPGSGRPSG